MPLYPSIRIEGGLLGPDLLDALVRADLPGQKPADFGLKPSRNLTDEIAAAFADARTMWGVFQNRLDRLSDDDVATTLTRDAWAVPFLGLLGYSPQFNARAHDVDGQTFAVSHRADDGVDSPPIHIVGARQELGRLPASGRPRMAPHSLLQEYLNRTEHVWGIVTNGRTVRLLRDCTLVRRQAYVEFDLAAMLEEQRFLDFSALYRLLHRTRLPRGMDGAGDCLLEKYHAQSIEQGGRVREHLREGVEECITQLANGFLRHPGNDALRNHVLADAAAPDRIAPENLYRQLLRLVYRFLFLMVSEDRGLLSDSAIYLDHYSITRLRRLLDQRAAWTDHDDLWQSLRVLWYLLRSDAPQTPLAGKPLASTLGLPVLNGELFEPQTLDDCEISNADLLGAFWNLSYYIERPERGRGGGAGGATRRVNYGALDVEELGSVYESLLEFHPAVDQPAGSQTPRFALVFGSDRKTTGSYYTPPELVGELIKSALEPVIEGRLAAVNKANPKAVEKALATVKEKALLSIRVCDPACGSGHFLLAASRRLGKELAKVRTGENEPAPESVREAIRDVVSHCIYGVDRNPLAVDLCRVALWLESHAEGKPLTFLDHRIRCGDSLIGVFDLAVLKAGIPDKAFEPLEGDDKATARAAARQNKDEREGQGRFFQANAPDVLPQLSQKSRQVDAVADELPEHVRQKRDLYESSHRDAAWLKQKELCDLWTAAFFQPFTSGLGSKPPITTGTLHDHAAGRAGDVHHDVLATAQALSARERFLHWPLEFPEVFADGGFDVMLSNPPWERVKLQEQEFFAVRDSGIANAPNKSARSKLIAALVKANPELYAEFIAAVRGAEGASLFMRQSGRFPLCGRGDINTYTVFAELNRDLTSPYGRAGVIVPTGIATDDTTKAFFGNLCDSRSLVSLFSFENEGFIFPGVHHAMKFCLLTLSGSSHSEPPDFLFFARRIHDLSDLNRRFRLSREDITLLSPNTRTCSVFRSQRDAALTKSVYARVPVFVRDTENGASPSNPWGATFLSMFHMASDSALFIEVTASEQATNDSGSLLPLLEAKMIAAFDHRACSIVRNDDAMMRQAIGSLTTTEQHQDPTFRAQPRYRVRREAVRERLNDWPYQGLLGFFDITATTNQRTMIAAMLPIAGVGHTMPCILVRASAREYCTLLANLNAFVFDYLGRQKLGGIHYTFQVLKQVPVIPPSVLRHPCDWSRSTTLVDWMASRVLELVYTSHDLAGFARDLGYVAGDGVTVKPPLRWEPARRAQLRAELDAAFFLLYGVSRNDAAYILDTFTVFKGRDEERNGGVYNTKETILKVYDELSHAKAMGTTWVSPLGCSDLICSSEARFRDRTYPSGGESTQGERFTHES